MIFAAIECCSLRTSEAENLLETGTAMTACTSVSFMCSPLLPSASPPFALHDLLVNCSEIREGVWVARGGLN